MREVSSEHRVQKDLAEVHLSLIEGSKRILGELERASRLCSRVLPLSFLFLGALAALLFLSIIPTLDMMISSIVLLSIGAWLAVRERLGMGCQCCTEDIKARREELDSLVREDGSLNYDKEEGVADTILRAMEESEGWVNRINRDMVSTLIWPSVAALVLLLSLASSAGIEGKLVVMGFVVYILLVALWVYVRAKRKFESWRRRASAFRSRERDLLEGA
jgi:hypothetical protein